MARAALSQAARPDVCTTGENPVMKLRQLIVADCLAPLTSLSQINKRSGKYFHLYKKSGLSVCLAPSHTVRMSDWTHAQLLQRHSTADLQKKATYLPLA